MRAGRDRGSWQTRQSEGMPERYDVDGFQESSTFDLLFSNNGIEGDLVPLCTLVIALVIFTAWHHLTAE